MTASWCDLFYSNCSRNIPTLIERAHTDLPFSHQTDSLGSSPFIVIVYTINCTFVHDAQMNFSRNFPQTNYNHLQPELHFHHFYWIQKSSKCLWWVLKSWLSEARRCCDAGVKSSLTMLRHRSSSLLFYNLIELFRSLITLKVCP